MSITTSTYNRISGYTAARDALEKAKAWRASLTRPSYEEPVTVSRLKELAMAPDGALPSDSGSRNRAFREQKQDRLDEIRLVESAIQQLKVDVKTRLFEGADEGLAYLDRALQKLVKDVRAVPPEVARLSEVDALRSDDGILELWESVETLIDRYDEIRSLQTVLARTHDDSGVVFQTGQLRNSLDFSPYWQNKRQRIDTSSALRDTNEHVQNYAHWLKSVPQPTFGHAATHWPIRDRRSYLFDMCAHDLWVPTIEVMNAANSAAIGATSRVSFNDLPHIEAARDSYYELIRTQPATKYTSSPGNLKPCKVRKATLGENYFGSIL